MPVSAISPDGSRGGEGDAEGAGFVEDLRWKLQEAEIDAAVSKKSATLHGITKALNPESVDHGAISLCRHQSRGLPCENRF